MANVLLGVTGSVAAIRTPQLFRKLCDAGFAVKIVATKASLYFFDPAALDRGNLPAKDNSKILFLDDDEWPGQSLGQRYARDDAVLHIELRKWADLLVVAPLDANTLAKMAHGLADNCLSCIWRAWDLKRPVVLAPAMNTLMWEHPLTERHLGHIADFFEEAKPGPGRESLVEWINCHCKNLRIISPQEKRLACGDVGQGAMAEVEEIVEVVKRVVNRGLVK